MGTSIMGRNRILRVLAGVMKVRVIYIMGQNWFPALRVPQRRQKKKTNRAFRLLGGNLSYFGQKRQIDLLKAQIESKRFPIAEAAL